MPSPDHQTLLQKAVERVRQLQNVDPASIARVDVLGSELNFQPAVEGVTRTVTFYQQLSVENFAEFSTNALRTLVERANGDFALLEEMRTFQARSGVAERERLLNSIENYYNDTFQALHTLIAYNTLRTSDFPTRLKSAQDAAVSLTGFLENQKEEAKGILESMRETSGALGVAQQASHFNVEAQKHSTASKVWLTVSVFLVIILLGYALLLLALRKTEFLQATGPYETTQLVLAKSLIFLTLSFFLVFASRSYLANRHNVVVNRHRQNALSVYTTLVKASDSEANRDIILTKAADCIFAAQATGFGRTEGGDSGHVSLISLGSNTLKPPDA